MSIKLASESVKIHPTAIIEDGVSVGSGTSVWDNVHIRKNAIVGENCIIGEKTYIAYDVKIGNAVKRNRAKRLLREASRKFYPEIQTGWDILLTARSPIAKAHYPAVEAALQNLFNKADLLVALNVR